MNSDQFRADILELTVEILEQRIRHAIEYIDAPDVGYGLSPIGLATIRDILMGEDDGPLGTPGFLDGEA